MNALSFDDLPDRAIRDLIDRFGTGATLRALLSALVSQARTRQRPLRADQLSDHIRADIGLPPRQPDPLSARAELSGRLYW
jgi:hypothetical protein